MKKYSIFSILFFGIIFAVLVCFLLQPASNGISETEKRALADLPELSWESRADFHAAFESYIADHFPFREKLLTAYALLEYKIFNCFSDSNIIIGKNDWFFYHPLDPEEMNAVKDVKGTDAPTEEELAQMVNDLENFQTWLAEKGIDFMIFISPNKANLYREMLPETAFLTNESRGDVTVRYIHEHSSLNIQYVKPELEAAKDGPLPIYYMHDDHWNLYGGWIGANAYTEAVFGKSLPMPEFSSVSWTGGDLASWTHLGGMIVDHNYVETDDIPEYEIKMNWGRWTNREYIPAAGSGQRMLMIGDSFAEAMVPYIVDRYSVISFRRFDCDYGYYDILDRMPEVVVLELTERYFTPANIHKVLRTEE